MGALKRFARCFTALAILLLYTLCLVSAILSSGSVALGTTDIARIYDSRIRVVCNLSIAKLRAFLESQYVPEVGLLRASAKTYPDNVTVWVASDNLLASKALEVLNSSYAPMVEKVLEEVFGGGYDGLHEVLLGVPIGDVPRNPVDIEVCKVYSSTLRTYIRVVYEKRCGAPITNWFDYADLLAYEALNNLLKGRRATAYNLFLKLVNSWSEWGFKDRATSGDRYETYKLALAIYLFRALLAARIYEATRFWRIIEKCCEIIHRLQLSNGGIATYYTVVNDSIVPISDANTETTSITVLSIYSDYPLLIGEKALGKERETHAHVDPLVLATTILTIATLLAVLHRKPIRKT